VWGGRGDKISGMMWESNVGLMEWIKALFSGVFGMSLRIS
jgi:hypothetical protein